MSQAIMQRQTTKGPSAWEVTLANTKLWLKSPTPYLNALGLVAFVLFWYLTTEYFQLPYFEKLPGPVASFQEWVSKDPIYGISIYTSDYYAHIGISVWRVFQAFMLATLLGVPTGLFMGWNKTFKDYSFPLLETLRPIPMLAWVPLAILMWPGREASIVFLTFLGSYFATVLNTLLGVESIDESYFRAARSLGARPRDVFFKVILPLSMPGVASGILMVFMPTISTFAISELLTMNNIKLFGTTIQENINNSMWNYGAALSLIMLFLIGASTLIAGDGSKQEGGIR